MSSDEVRCSRDKNNLRFRLHRAVNAEDLERVRSILEQGANINQPNEWGEIALHLAATQKNPHVANFLLDYEADLYARQENGMTPLDMAAWCGRVETTRMLLQKGASRSQADLQRAVRKATMDDPAGSSLYSKNMGLKSG